MADEKQSVSFTGDPEELLKKYMKMKMLGDAGEKAIGYIMGDSEMEKLQKEALKLDIESKKQMLGEDYGEPFSSPHQKTLALGLVARSLPAPAATELAGGFHWKSAKIGENLLRADLTKTHP